MEKQIPAVKLVPGDIVKIRMGDKIPADIRILQSREMKVDNSCLTGESDALLRSTECTHPDSVLETQNLAFFGTLCKEGNGIGIVVNIGDNTVMGQIASLVSHGEPPSTPLNRELLRFVIMISIIAISMGIALFLFGILLLKQGVSSSF